MHHQVQKYLHFALRDREHIIILFKKCSFILFTPKNLLFFLVHDSYSYFSFILLKLLVWKYLTLFMYGYYFISFKKIVVHTLPTFNSINVNHLMKLTKT